MSDEGAGAAQGSAPAPASAPASAPATPSTPAPTPGGGSPLAPIRRRSPLDELASIFLAFVPGAFIVVLTFFYYQHAADRQFAAVSAACGSEAGRVQGELVAALDQRALAIERLAAERAEGTDAWAEDAAVLAAGPLQLRAVLEYDSTLALGRVIPAETRLMSALDPRDDEARRIALHAGAGSSGREAVTVSTAPLAAGERQVLACAPVMRGSRRLGWIVGVMRLRDVVDAGLQRTLHDGFSAGVFEGPTLLYGASTEEAGAGARYTQEATVLRGPLIWKVEVWPGEDLANELDSQGPPALFVAGMLLAMFASASVFMWREQRAASRG